MGLRMLRAGTWVLIGLLVAGKCAQLSDEDNALNQDLTSRLNPTDPVQTALNRTAAMQNMTDTDAKIALEKAKASEERMQVRLTRALKAVDYCQLAQSMLTGEQQEKSLKMQKFLDKRVAKALEGEREQMQKTEQALAECRQEAEDKARLGPDCTKQELQAIKLKSGHKICETKLSAMKKEMKVMKDNHKIEIDKLAGATKEPKKPEKEIQKAAKKLNEKEMDQLSVAQQHILLLKGELSAKSKESESVKLKLRNLQADCSSSHHDSDEQSFSHQIAILNKVRARHKSKNGKVDLGETKEVLGQDNCARLVSHTDGVCDIVGSSHSACKQLLEMLDSKCSKVAQERAHSHLISADTVQMLQA